MSVEDQTERSVQSNLGLTPSTKQIKVDSIASIIYHIMTNFQDLEKKVF